MTGPDDRLAPLSQAVVTCLTWGFRVGAAFLAGGLAWALYQREPLNTDADPFVEVVPTVLAGEAAGIVDLAILWLMMTPVAAVVVLLVGFLRLGERRYALLSLVVLLILGFSIGLALRR